MFAVVFFGGKQHKVREKDELEVEKMELEPGKNFKIESVLLIAEEDGSQLKLGMPYVAGAHVECQVLEQGKGEKIRVFKFQAKKRYHLTQGHRQKYTLIKVLKISAVGGKAVAPKEEKAVVAEKMEPATPVAPRLVRPKAAVTKALAKKKPATVKKLAVKKTTEK